MKTPRLKSTGIGALVALLVCVGYLLFGPMGLFGEPEAAWAKVVFYPGIWMGWRAWEWFHSPQWFYMTVGVATMTLIGATFGLGIHWLRRRLQPSAPDANRPAADGSSTSRHPGGL